MMQRNLLSKNHDTSTHPSVINKHKELCIDEELDMMDTSKAVIHDQC